MLLLKVLRKIVKICSVFYFTNRSLLILRALGCNPGNSFTVDGKVYFKVQKKQSIRFGAGIKINSRFGSNLVGIANHAAFQTIGEGTISVGDNVGMTSVIVSSRSKVVIGKNSMLGGNVRIYDHDYHSLSYQDRRSKLLDGNNCKTKPVIIGEDVFVGTNSIILKGVTIGDRSIVGAGSVVSNLTIPPDSLVIGNPAVIVKRK